MTDPNQGFSQIRIEDLPYLDKDALHERSAVLMPLYADGSWHDWSPPSPNGLLQRLRPADFKDSVYLAKDPASVADVRVLFLEWAIKHAAHLAGGFRDAVQDDILNLCASLAKFDLLHANQWLSRDTSRMALTELEYILVVCRSLFDLLQELILRVWRAIELLDKTRKKQGLPKSFREMVMKSDRRRSAEDLQAAFGLPPQLGEFYVGQANFFLGLRSARDTIVHEPSSPPTILRLDEGFAIDVTTEPFATLLKWPDGQLRNGKLGSLRYWVAHCVLNTLAACEQFSLIVSSCIQFPRDFAPGYRIFLRSPHTMALGRLRHILEVDSWAPFVPGVGRHERLAQIAYELWQNEGRPGGKEQEHWYAAERILSRITDARS